MFMGLAFAMLAAFAWPLPDEVVKVRPIVDELMSSEKSLSPGAAADAACAFADDANTEAARYLLLSRAVELYAKANDDDKTAAAFKKLVAKVKDVPPTVQERILLSAGRTLAKVRRPVKTEALFKGVRALVWAESELVAARRTLRSTKKEVPEAHLRAGNALAVMGDWLKALGHLSDAKGKIAPIADQEINGTATVDKLADAWWKASAIAESGYVKSAYRLHATELYRKALAANLLEGLNKTLAERRVAEVEKESETDVVAQLASKQGENAEKVKVGKVQLWEGGPYWAEMNIGATKPEVFGYYFWWGDTVGYKRENHAWVSSNGSSANFSFSKENTPNIPTGGKSINDLESGGWITADGVLAPEHDAAHVHWGGAWRMPTKQELDDLQNNCDWTWTTMNGVKGHVVKGKGAYASANIFLPCAGYGNGTSLGRAGSFGYYWSSVPSSSYGYNAWHLDFLSGIHSTRSSYRYYGRPVRPVQGFTK